MEQEMPNVAQEAPSTNEQSVEANVPAEKPSDSDLFKRVSEFQKQNSVEEKTESEVDADFFSDPKFREKIDAIEDPELKDHLIRLRKSGIGGVSKKMQEIAEIRKELQEIKQGSNGNNGDFYNIEKQLNDPEWQRKAQEYSSRLGNSSNSVDEEYLTDNEKALMEQVRNLENKFESIQDQNKKANQEHIKSVRIQQHNQLQSKYANYNPGEIDTITSDMIQGRIQATPEHVYKAFKHDDNVKNAYELGRRDALEGRASAPPSIEGIQTRRSDPEITPDDKETDRSYMKRVIDNVIRKSQEKTQV